MADNPFRLRASEQATRDEQFLSLVGPHVLDMLPADQLWDRLIIIESAPGAGKTTILRLFTPTSLSSLQRLGDQDAYRPLSDRLRRLGVLNAQGPTVAGILINCREQYATIQDLPFDRAIQIRWFFGLLNARIVLLTLRTALASRGLSYPSDVGRIEVRPNSESTSVTEPIRGDELYGKARDAELHLTNSLNTLEGVDEASPFLLSDLQVLRVLSTSDFFVDGSAFAERFLLMFDDVHELAYEQREALRRDLERRDLTIGRWIARRSQALEPVELLTFARTKGRDYEQIHIEEWAQGNRRRGQVFFDLLDEIGARRAQRAQIGVDNLDSCLMAELTSREAERASEARDKVKQEVLSSVKGQYRFSEWIAREIDAVGDTSNPYAAAIGWRKLLISIEHQMGKGQLSLDLPLPLSQLQNRDSSSIKTAAELFLAKEYRLPFYYGVSRLKQLSSWNIEQFLRIAGDLFEQILASEVLSRGKTKHLTAAQQDALLRKMSREQLLGLPKEVPLGADVQRLVQAIGTFCHEQTHRPTAPYAPGMTGVGISTVDASRLGDAAQSTTDTALHRLSSVIASAVANNVLEVRPNVRVKNGTWTIFHLNRLYCPAFELPLGYSGYRENVGIDVLASWMAFGSQPQSSMRLGL